VNLLLLFQRNKAPNEQAIPLLMPHHHMVIPHYKGRSKETNGEAEGKQNDDDNAEVKKKASLASCASYQDVPLLLPQELEPQALPDGDLAVTGFEIDQADNVNKTGFKQPLLNRKAKVDASRQDLPMRGFVDNLSSVESASIRRFDSAKEDRHHMDKKWWERQERGDQVASVLDIGQVGPRATCRCQVSILVLCSKYPIISLTLSNKDLCLSIALHFSKTLIIINLRFSSGY
jgi:phospholipase D1/2